MVVELSISLKWIDIENMVHKKNQELQVPKKELKKILESAFDVAVMVDGIVDAGILITTVSTTEKNIKNNSYKNKNSLWSIINPLNILLWSL